MLVLLKAVSFKVMKYNGFAIILSIRNEINDFLVQPTY